ncbi:MAG: hypothetical protein A2428_13430 [Bdellovibrionales bacterium RIFOXYC1_FULL_54_43]|nr:MAG: hypothetical protein A2428_13430 [Bdellovibrionales bacterium RIFOXYC1_FULL_54_43]OFZ81966.1 MAG: hypothetical protein A2603_05115 [Bdellovibrionales bacterium RIFOXYD1_FULL_55_31]
MSIVEETLRSQRQVWREIVERVSRISVRELTPEAPKRILLFGLGSSHFAARLTAYALMRDRTRARIPVVACSSMSIGPEITPVKGDWAIAFSHRGQSRATLKALKIADQAGAFTIMVAGQGAPEAETVRYNLPTSPQERCEPHTMAVTGSICAVTTLMLGMKVAEEWDALRSFPDPDLEVYRDRARSGPSLLLGEWEGEWLAREAALKLMEMARLPVRVFGSEEFFHGPRFSVQKGDSIWHISLPKDARAPEIDAAYRIEVSGNSPLAFMPALVELQWLALAVALNRGVDPDQP